jgi:cytoskeleton protein RodZ
MPTIGESLREARMRQHLDIADVEGKTKIRAKYLRALENEEFGMLPGPTFVKTFLRTYAEALGLDPQALVEEYRATYEPREELDLQPLGPTAVARDRRRVGPPRGPWVGIAAAVVAIVAALALVGLLTGGGDDNNSSSSGNQSPTQTTKPKKKQKPKQKTAPAATTVTLKITPSNQVYVCLDKGAGTPIVFEGILDSARTFKGGKLLRLNLGKTDVQVTKNGKAVAIQPGPEPVGFTFTPTTTKPLALGDRPCA